MPRSPRAERRERPPAPPTLTQEQRDGILRRLRAGDILQIIPGAPSVAWRDALPPELEDDAKQQTPLDPIREEALKLLRKTRSDESIKSILDYASYVAHQLALFRDWPPGLTRKERTQAIRLLEDAKPLLERAFPLLSIEIVGTVPLRASTGESMTMLTIGELLGTLLDRLKNLAGVPRGERRKDHAIFARMLLAWSAREAAKKRIEAPLTPVELLFAALLASIEPVPSFKPPRRFTDWIEEIRPRWEKLHQRSLGRLRTDKNRPD